MLTGDGPNVSYRLDAHFRLGLGTGVFVANPIPTPAEMPRDLYDQALQAALADMKAEGVRGHAVTTFLLDRLRAFTSGDSVRTNLALLLHDARVAARLATELAARVA